MMGNILSLYVIVMFDYTPSQQMRTVSVKRSRVPWY